MNAQGHAALFKCFASQTRELVVAALSAGLCGCTASTPALEDPAIDFQRSALSSRVTTVGDPMSDDDCAPFNLANLDRSSVIADAVLNSAAFEDCVRERSNRYHVPNPGDHSSTLSIDAQVTALFRRLRTGVHVQYTCREDSPSPSCPSAPGRETSWSSDVMRLIDSGSGGPHQPAAYSISYWDQNLPFLTSSTMWESLSETLIHELAHAFGYGHPSTEFRCHDSSCGGTATACESLRDRGPCAAQQGCGWTGSACETHPCAALSNEACWLQPGCSWNGTTCDGTATGPRQCATFRSSSGDGHNCAMQRGCAFENPIAGCLGAATPCSGLQDRVRCDHQWGCAWSDSACRGTVIECSAFSSSAVCDTQSGCGFNTVGCSGVAGCTAFATQAICDAHAGCSFNAELQRLQCEGTPTACEALSVAECPTHPGCSTSGLRCRGTPEACTRFAESSTCANQGCWLQNSCTATNYASADACGWTFLCGGTGIPTAFGTGDPMPQWDWEEWHGLGSPERAAALAGRGEGGYRNAESDPSFPYIISACAGELLRQSNDADGCGGLFPSSCEPDDVRLLSNWSSPARRFSGTCACFPAGRHPAHFAAPDGSHFLAATNAGGSTLMTSSSATGPWESFYIVDLNGGRLMDHDAIQIRTWASNAACLGLGMSACGSTSGCLWTPFAAGGGSCNPGGYSLQAGAALGSSPNANCTSSVSCGGLAQWQIRHADGSPGRILDGQLVGLFNIGRGRFLSARDQGGSTLTTDQTFIGPWETFTYLEPRRALLVNVRAPDGTYARYDGVTSTLTTSALENEYDASGNARIEARQQSFWVVDHNGGALNYGDSVSFEWSLGPAEWSGCANGPGALSGDDVFTSQACERFAISACHGAATLCGNLTPQGQSACAAQQGCAWLNSACRDFPRVTDCSALTSQATCSTQRGCLFGGPIRHHDTVTLRVTGAGFVRQNGSQLQANANALSASSFMLDFAQGRAACTGSALCINQVDASSCTAHAGCTWGNACIGTATACGGLSGASCTAQSGCRLSGATCLGVAMTCTTRASASSCSAQAGCSWGNASRFQVY